MNKILIICLLLSVCLTSQSQEKNCSVVLNHFLIVVDSATYEAALNSEFLNNELAFAREKKLKMWEGFYIVGDDNYIELFHQNSYYGEILPIGDTWICHTSLKANCIEQIELEGTEGLAYYSNDYFDKIGFNTVDSSNLIEIWENNKLQYETWVKKPFHDSMTFETVDYNSPAEVDSSKNYLFENVKGIQLEISAKDSVNLSHYLSLIGYEPELNSQGQVTFSNDIDFIELNFTQNVITPKISVIYFKMRKDLGVKRFSIGNSEMVLEGYYGMWLLNKK